MSDKWENFILHELTDDELNDLTDEEKEEIESYYESHPLPESSTVRGLLKKLEIRYDDLTDFILGLDLGICNHAVRVDNLIFINRENSPLGDNIFICLDEDNGGSDVTISKYISKDTWNEKGFTRDGVLEYEGKEMKPLLPGDCVRKPPKYISKTLLDILEEALKEKFLEEFGQKDEIRHIDFIDWKIKNIENEGYFMYDLDKLNEKFHEFLTDGLSEEQIEKRQLPDLSEDLFTQMKEIKWRYVSLRYFLAVDGEMPILYVWAYSTVHDLSETFVIDESSIKLDEENMFFKKAREHRVKNFE